MSCFTKLFLTTGPMLAALPVTNGVAAANHRIVIKDLQSAEGLTRVPPYRRNADLPFPGPNGIVAQASRPANINGVHLTLADPPTGDYALAAFHDVSSDGELAQNIRGIPIASCGNRLRIGRLRDQPFPAARPCRRRPRRLAQLQPRHLIDRQRSDERIGSVR